MHKRGKHATIKHETYSSDIILTQMKKWRHAVARLVLRHCTTSRKVAGSIPDGVTEILH
jgi:hypothetical protein